MSLQETNETTSRRKQSKKPKNLTELFMEVRRLNPRFDKDRLIAAFQDRVRDDYAWIDEASETWARLNYKKLFEPRPPINTGAQAAERKAIQQIADSKMQDRLHQMILGLTFGEVARLAKMKPQLAKIAKLGKPDQRVGEVLTLKQLEEHLEK